MEQADLMRRLQTRLEHRAIAKTKVWWEAYLKEVIPFRGVKMAGVRSALHEWYAQEAIASQLSLVEQKDLALGLFEKEFAEDKIAGILFLQEILLPAGAIEWATDLARFADLFSQGWIYDWNVCDWFCVKVLGPLVERDGEACARAIAQWRTSQNLWQRRASGIAFVNLAKRGDENFPGFTQMLLEICAATVEHPQRFSQTGTGWVLRELSVYDAERVEGFVSEHMCQFSKEGLQYAMRKLSPGSRQILRWMRAECC